MEPLLEGSAALGLSLTAEQVGQFHRYQSLLLAWNQRINLTAVSAPAAIQTRHFVDSLTCVLATGDLDGRRLIDVGSGAGFPGVPLKLLYPGLQLTLAESVAKKARFLELLVDELGLAPVTVIAERAEALGQDPQHREAYDWAVARAVAPLPILAELLLPLCRLGGRALAQKGAAAAEEIAAAANAVRVLGGGKITPLLAPLAAEADAHYLVVIEKTAPTPQAYPRRPGIPAKRPL
jgi:16S rRNA (guanine527-N7)-methyltransferase